MRALEGLVVVLHDASSQSKLVDFVRVALAFRRLVELVVLSKPSGGGAMYGLPEASKIAYREAVNLLVVPDLRDVKELLPGRRLVMVDHAGGRVVSNVREAGRPGELVLAFSASETGFSRKELELADDVIRLEALGRPLPPDAYLALVLFLFAVSE